MVKILNFITTRMRTIQIFWLEELSQISPIFTHISHFLPNFGKKNRKNLPKNPGLMSYTYQTVEKSFVFQNYCFRHFKFFFKLCSESRENAIKTKYALRRLTKIRTIPYKMCHSFIILLKFRAYKKTQSLPGSVQDYVLFFLSCPNSKTPKRVQISNKKLRNCTDNSGSSLYKKRIT